jgi:hypothetical protein
VVITDPRKPCHCEDGITPHIDTETGNWFLGEEDTGVKAQGPKGEDGECDCNPDNIKIDICHNGNTLNLPLPAALNHLQNHSGDTVGPCPE